MSATGIKRINVNLLLGFVLSFFINSAFAQNLDSLWNIWQNEPMLADTSRINAALSFAKDLTKKQPLRSVELGEAVMKLVDEQARSGVLSDSLAYKFKKRTFNILVIAYSNVGDNQRALEALLANLALAQKKGDKKSRKTTLMNIGVAYQRQGYPEESRSYYRQSLALAHELKDTYGEAMCLGNIGTSYGSRDHPDSALYYYQRSLEVMSRPDMYDQGGAMGWMMENIGQWYENQAYRGIGETDRALVDSAFHYYKRSLAMRESVDHQLGQIPAHTKLAELYKREGEPAKAMEHINKSIRIGEKNGFRDFLYNSYNLRSKLRSERGDFRGAYADHLRYTALKDSLIGEKNTKELVEQTTRYEYGRQLLADSLKHAAAIAVKSEEVRREKVVRNGFMGGFALVALFAGVFFVQRIRISKEKARSEELLLNILPEEVAEELKAKGAAEAVQIDQVTVLFTDFKGFTDISERLSPKELVKDLHECFSAFDRITENYGIEKIKTIGDAYMAAGGLPTPNNTHAIDVIKAALEMRDFISAGKAKKVALRLPFFEIRIGIHTGPVVAGIVGVKKFSYDIWGDTVNTASRMESSGEVGKVNISKSTYALLKDHPDLVFESRGKIEAKGKGEIEMYFVSKV